MLDRHQGRFAAAHLVSNQPVESLGIGVSFARRVAPMAGLSVRSSRARQRLTPPIAIDTGAAPSTKLMSTDADQNP
jgi:hypothetical protein